MAYTVRDLSNAQRFEYKGYEVFMYCVEDSFWSGERTYKVDISISNHVYYRIAEDIQIARYQQQRQNYFSTLIPTPYNRGYNGIYDIMKKLKERILFSSSFNVIVKRKFTILKDNEPYVRDAMEQIKSIIDSKFGNVDDRFKNIQNII